MNRTTEPATFRQQAAARPAAQGGQRLGRFELRRRIGEGAQAAVWLAFDPRLEREVAVKRLHAGADFDVSQWLQEARSVSRLAHPNIIPLFEADIEDGKPYLVFEYVAGQTLAATLRARGALPPREAVGLICEVLEALVVAHAQDIVHRDLKPSNILIDAAGHARVMDFGIAARISEDGGTRDPGGGTPGYISPEAARNEAPAPSMDIFSAALVLAEMLAGRAVVRERDASTAIRRALETQLELPAELGSDVDDGLRAIVRRGLMREAAQRYPDVATFLAALRAWLHPAGDAAGTSEGAGGGTLEFLLRRMRHKSDFPALSGTVTRIQSLSISDSESVASLTNEILKDVALTNKLLRLVNSAHYARGGAVSTVSRAVTLVGFNGIRTMALSLVLLEHMQDKAHASQLREEFLRSLMAGSIARELVGTAQEAEEAFLGAMFQNLGRLLAEYYFPEEARAVRARLASREAASEESASIAVLGLSYEALGSGIARAWGLPDTLQRCICRPVGDPPASAPSSGVERMRWTCLAANEMADTLLQHEPAQAATRLTQLGQRYARTLGTSGKGVAEATQTAREKLVELARAMELRVAPASAAARLLHAQGQAPAVQAPADAEQATLASHELHATQQPRPAEDERRKSQQVAEMLAAGIQDITNAMVEDFRLVDVLRMILETMWRAMEFRYVVFCMRDPRGEIITGRFGLGSGVERVVKAFRFAPRGADLFGLVCVKGADTMIDNTADPRIVANLPAWYRQGVAAPAFLLLPLTMKGAPFGLIYADKGEQGALQLGEKELALLRTLRNQAVMAFKQSS